MFIIWFFLGFFSCFIFVTFSISTLIFIINRKGREIISKAENIMGVIKDFSEAQSEIIYPKFEKEIFNKEETIIDDLLKE